MIEIESEPATGAINVEVPIDGEATDGLAHPATPGDEAADLLAEPAERPMESTPHDEAKLTPHDEAELTPHDEAELTPHDEAELTPHDEAELTPHDEAELTPHDEPLPRRAAGAAVPAGPARTSFRQLEDVILDDSFPEVDLALRRGRHIHPGDERWYEFLLDAQGLLEPFYRRFGCALEQRNDGYFFLLPVGDGLSKRHLGVPEMIVGQGLALCFLDPRTVPAGGVIAREELLNQLASVMGTDALMRALNPKRKRADERVMQRTVRQKVNEALRRLSLLGFVELLDGDQLRLWPSLMRFAEPVRGLDAPSEALKRLIERGEVSLGPGDDADEPRAAPDADSDSESDLESESDSSSDSVSASDPDSDSVTGSDSVTDSDSVTGSDSVTDYDSVTGSDSELDVSLPPELDLDWDAPPGEEA